jgi:hypothetical protein
MEPSKARAKISITLGQKVPMGLGVKFYPNQPKRTTTTDRRALKIEDNGIPSSRRQL